MRWDLFEPIDWLVFGMKARRLEIELRPRNGSEGLEWALIGMALNYSGRRALL